MRATCTREICIMYIHSNNIQKLFSFHFLIMCCAKGESRWKKNWLNNFLCSFLRDTPPPRSSSYIHILKSSLLFYICSLYEQSKGGTFTRTSHTLSLSLFLSFSPQKCHSEKTESHNDESYFSFFFHTECE